ncbi:MAG TPA: M67 family peptidase [Sneathiellales bacterium]|jgi:proteasome lid subunit RPN8/RPN11|nr:M67 family peptidase [Sneathiellales bacterium]
MIVLTPAHLRQIVDLAEAAYPAECCGLLVGKASDTSDVDWRVARVEPSENMAPAGRNDRFEIDPLLRLRLQKELRDGAESVIGVYHSHPDGPAQPSLTDLENAWEPELIWLITSVNKGQAIQTTAHRLVEQALRFEDLPLRTSDWRQVPTRPPVDGLPSGE